MKNSLLEEMVGLKIAKCYRYFYENFSDSIPDDLIDQETDGSLCVLFSNNLLIEFIPKSEDFSINISQKGLNYLENDKLKDVSNNSFWSKFTNKSVKNVTALKYGFRISFENLDSIEILYFSETDYTFDALVIRQALE